MTGSVTVAELAEQTGIPAATIRYHCRDPRGALYGVARRSGRTWLIPAPASVRFAQRYRRYGTLRRKTGPEPPPGPGPVDTATKLTTPAKEEAP